MTDDQKVESVRADIARIKEEIEWTERACIPRDEARAWIGEEVERLATDGGFIRAIAGHAVLSQSRKHMSLQNILAGQDLYQNLNPHSRTVLILASIFKDDLKAKLLAALDAHEYEAGLPQNERPKRLRDLKARLFELECREEALIENAEERGIQIMRRADADPIAVLNYNPDGDAGIRAESRFTPHMVGVPSTGSGGGTASAGSNQLAARGTASTGHHFPISPAAIGVHGRAAPSSGSDSSLPNLPAPGSFL